MASNPDRPARQIGIVILGYIADQTGFFTAHGIADATGQSFRTVHYYLTLAHARGWIRPSGGSKSPINYSLTPTGRRDIMRFIRIRPEDRVLRALQDGQWHTQDELRLALGVRQGWVSTQLKALLQNGLIEKPPVRLGGYNQYRVTASGLQRIIELDGPPA